MINKYFLFIIGYAVFTVIAGYYFISNTMGYIDEYQLSCDETFIVPDIPYIVVADKSYYFDNSEATCDKLNFLVYFMIGLTIFVIGIGMVTFVRFIVENEVHIMVRKR